jgi:hypothetical protein
MWVGEVNEQEAIGRKAQGKMQQTRYKRSGARSKRKMEERREKPGVCATGPASLASTYSIASTPDTRETWVEFYR